MNRRELVLLLGGAITAAPRRHIRAGRIHERDGKLYATSPAAEQAHATA
jgi:hypothetical protein